MSLFQFLFESRVAEYTSATQEHNSFANAFSHYIFYDLVKFQLNRRWKRKVTQSKVLKLNQSINHRQLMWIAICQDHLFWYFFLDWIARMWVAVSYSHFKISTEVHLSCSAKCSRGGVPIGFWLKIGQNGGKLGGFTLSTVFLFQKDMSGTAAVQCSVAEEDYTSIKEENTENSLLNVFILHKSINLKILISRRSFVKEKSIRKGDTVGSEFKDPRSTINTLQCYIMLFHLFFFFLTFWWWYFIPSHLHLSCIYLFIIYWNIFMVFSFFLFFLYKK